MQLRFTKMQGLGNDFVMVDAISQKVSITPERAKRLADRHFGVGCDQVLVVEAPQRADADFRYRIFNQDGAEVENCGNGARCFALFVRQRGLTSKHIIVAEPATGILTLKVHDNNLVTVNMGEPVFDPASIPFAAEQEQAQYSLNLGEERLSIFAASMGNPHAVTCVDDLDHYPVAVVGAQLEQHPRFPKRVNAGFMQVVSRDEIRLRVFERGVGETLACGTGACAAVVTGIQNGLLNNSVKVQLRGGELEVSWGGVGKPVMMTGPAKSVFKGQISLP